MLKYIFLANNTSVEDVLNVKNSQIVFEVLLVLNSYILDPTGMIYWLAYRNEIEIEI